MERPVWNGGSATDNNWSAAANWNGDGIGANNLLYFGGYSRLNNTNNTSAGTAYSNIVFDAGAGAFTLNGNSITLDGNITNDSPVSQTVNLGLNFNSSFTLCGASGLLDIAGGLTNTLGSGVTTLSLDGSGQLSDLWICANNPGGTNMIVLNDSAAYWTVVHNAMSTGSPVPWVFEVNAGTLNFGAESSAPNVNSTATHNEPKDCEIANNSGATATFNMINGTLTLDAPLDTCNALSSTGIVTQTGGTLNVNGSPYYFQGANGSSTGEDSIITINGGTMNMGTATAPNSGPFYVASRGNGTLTVSGSGVLNCSTLDLSRNAAGNTFGSIGVVNLNGGTLTASRVSTATANQQAGPASDGINPSATFNFNGGTLRAAASSTTFYQGSIASPAIPITSFVQSGGAVIDSSNYSITVLEPLQSGTVPDGGLTKLGTGTLTLAQTNSYNGPTLVTAGTLVLSGAGEISNSVQISVSGGATFDASAVAGGLNIASGQELTRNGAVKGNIIISSGAMLAPGGSLSTLVFNNNLALSAGSMTVIEVSHSPLTNDAASVVGNLAYAGTLMITNAGVMPLAAGDSFKLFSASSYSGAFANISPASPGPNLAWNTNNLNSGVLSVVSQTMAPTVSPVVTGFSLSGHNVVISGNNAQAGATYYLLTCTNLLLPISQWTAISTNIAAANSFTFTGTNAVSPGDPQQFYILSGTNN